MATPKKFTIGALIDRLAAKNREIKAKEQERKALEEEAEKLESQIMERMDAEQTATGSGKTATATINESVVPQVVDWDKFYDYIYQNRWFHLLQRRPSTPGCRELFESGKAVPGVDPFKKRKINLRSL